jgi:segregation and condensation protein A
VYDPGRLSAAIGDLLLVPPPVDVRHITVPRVTVAERLILLRRLLTRGRFRFSEAVANADRVTVAVTLYALLELYKQGEASWIQDEPFAEIMVTRSERDGERPRLSAVPERGAA